MRSLPALFLLASSGFLIAQVKVEVLLEQDQFLRDESLPVKVRITNRSGQTIHLGKEADWLSFVVENRQGVPVARSGEVPVTGEFSLESALLADRRVDLMPYFDLGEPGRYRVTAIVRIKQWNEEVASIPKEFDVIRGAKIWEQEFGVPAKEGLPEVRKYALVQANQIKRLMLYLRVTDAAEHRIFRVLAMGELVSFSKPEAQIDQESNVHVLFQVGSRAFNYTVVSPDGALLSRQTYDYAQTRPALRAREQGRITVAGGVRRVTKMDLPEPSTSVPTNEVQPRP